MSKTNSRKAKQSSASTGSQGGMVEGGQVEKTFPRVCPEWERRALLVVLALVALVEINAVFHRGVIGQDFELHANIMLAGARDMRTLLNFEHPDPPLLYAIGAWILRVTRGIHALEIMGLLHVVVSLFTLVLLHRLAQPIIQRPLLRLAFVVLVGFLPVYLIHGVVIAGDGWSCFFFAAILLVLRNVPLASTPVRRHASAAAVGGLLILGALFKYTFVSTILAAALWLVQMARRKTSGWKTVVVWILPAVVVPLIFWAVQIHMHKDFTDRLGVGFRLANAMNLRSLLFLRTADWHVLDAPAYTERLSYDGVPPTEMEFGGVKVPIYLQELLFPNRYSYPALLHLGIFTDLLNIFQYDPSYSAPGIPIMPPRPARSAINQARMALAVKTAVPLSLISLLAVIGWVLSYLKRGLWRPGEWSADVELILVPSLAWFANIVIFFPFIPHVYNGGYWLPRLILPAITGFCALAVAALDRVTTRWRLGALPYLFTAYVLLQSALHVSFLWPWVNL